MMLGRPIVAISEQGPDGGASNIAVKDCSACSMQPWEVRMTRLERAKVGIEGFVMLSG
jgi:hypothetical protein